ncbi:hypothetical protein [Streptomyces sp. NPDC006739]|uniref:hypothetical protein n=1 Tax=Streptomyces sp. NPDC006739 TaxID=3364763 RepID=UPI0036AAC386
MTTAPDAPLAAKQAPTRPETRNDPSEPSGGSPETHHEAATDPGPVAELRDAAAKLRNLIANASYGPWRTEWHGQEYQLQGNHPDPTPIAEWTYAIATWEPKASEHRAECDTADADYIAAMHPGVGAALAELLETEADVADEVRRQSPDLTDAQLAAHVHGPLAIARALNGEEAGR